jgi:hypothetical protein
MPKPASFDVAVVGGGAAGVAAAIAAARLGARTLLAERSERLGGNATQAGVHTICGLYRAVDAGEPVWANPGFPRRFAQGFAAAGGAGPVERVGRVYVLPTYAARIAPYAAELCAALLGSSLRLRTELIGVDPPTAAGEPARLVLREPGGDPENVEAAIVVDSSGDAAAGALASAELAMAEPDELQLPSFIFRMGGADRSELGAFERLRITHAIAGAVRSGALPVGCESVLLRPGEAADELVLTLNLPRPTEQAYDPLDACQRERLEALARGRAERVAAFLVRTRPAFAGSRIVAWPERLGIRESRRLRGLETLTAADVLEGRSRQDEVAVSTWPIELWQDHRRARFEHPRGPSSIPLGALVSRSHAWLGMAGRCLSATHEALGALRVIGTALATGEAVGVAAALAADAGSALDAIAAKDVRHHILALGETEEAS